jgi:hypothetical protein
MTELTYSLFAFAVMSAMVAYPCGGYNPRDYLRTMINPLSKDFWLPRCPFCWVARFFAAVGVAALFIPVS